MLYSGYSSQRKSANPRCAVLLAVYNGVEWIDEQIASIFSQRGVDVTIFISVDLSSDRSYEQCLDWSSRDSRVITLSYGKRFGGAASNFFRLTKEVDVSNFDLVAFADQDDIWLGDKLHTAWLRLSEGNYDAYSSDVVAFWPDGRKAIIKKSGPQRSYDHLYEAAGPGCTYVFKVEVFQAIQAFLIGRYDECLEVALHDWLFYAYCRQSHFKWYIDNKPLMLYRQHSENQIGTNDNLSAYANRLNMIRNGWYRDQIRKIGRLVAPALESKLTNRLFIITHFTQMRRRPRDRIALLISALTGLL